MVNGEIVNAAKPHLLEFPGDGGAAVGQLSAVVEGLEQGGLLPPRLLQQLAGRLVVDGRELGPLALVEAGPAGGGPQHLAGLAGPAPQLAEAPPQPRHLRRVRGDGAPELGGGVSTSSEGRVREQSQDSELIRPKLCQEDAMR